MTTTRARTRFAVSATLAILILSVGLLLFAHSPVVRGSVLRWAIGRLAGFGIHASAGSLDYNLLTGTVEVGDVSIAARGRADNPFFSAARARIDLRWSALPGTFVIDDLDIDNPRVVVHTDRAGGSNLPSIQRDAEVSTAAIAVPVRNLNIRNLELSVRDDRAELAVEMHDLTLTLAPSGRRSVGTVALNGAARISWQGHVTAVERLDGQVGFDGTRLSIEEAEVATPEASLALTGNIDKLLGRPEVDLRVLARVNLERTLPWVAPGLKASGWLDVSGRVSGPAAGPSASLDISGSQLAWMNIAGVSVEASMDLTPDALTLGVLRSGFAGGQLEGQARIDLSDGEQVNRLSLQWREIDADRLLTGIAAVRRLRLDAELAGRLDARWIDTRPENVTLIAENRTRTGGRYQQGAGVDGTIGLTLDSGRWHVNTYHRIGHAIRVRGSAGGRTGQARFGSSTLGGSISIELTDIASAGKTLGALQLAGEADLSELTGSARLDVTLDGTFDAPRYRGAFDVTDLAYGAVGPGTIKAAFTGSMREIVMGSLDAVWNGGAVHASGRVRPETAAVDARVDVTVSDLRSLASGLPLGLRPDGEVTATAVVSGRLPAPHVRAAVSGTELKVAGQRIDRWSAKLRLDDHTLIADDIALLQSDGLLQASGRYDFRHRTYDVVAAGRNLVVRNVPGAQPGEPFVPIYARIDLQLSGSGSLDDPRGRGRLHVAELSLGGVELGTIESDMTVEDRSLILDVSAPDVGLASHARLGLKPIGPFSAGGTLDLDLGRLIAKTARPLPFPVTGTAALAFESVGNLLDLKSAGVKLDLRGLDARLGELPFSLAAPASVIYERTAFDVGNVRLLIGRSSLRAAGRLETRREGVLAITLDGQLSDLKPLVDVFLSVKGSAARPFAADGHVRLEMRAAGVLDRPTILADVSLTGGEVRLGDLPPVTGVTLRAAYRDGVLTIEQLGAIWQQASITLSGYVPARLLEAHLPNTYLATLPPQVLPARLSGRIDQITPAVVQPFVDAGTLGQLQGEIAASLELEADRLSVDGLRATIELTRADLAFANVPLAQQSLTRIVTSDGRVRVADSLWAGGDNRVTIGGGAELSGDPSLDLIVEGTLDLRLLRAFMPNVAVDGRASLRLRVAGTASHPEIDGRVDIADAEMRMPEIRLAISDLNGALILSRDRLTVSELAGSANGGTIRVTGELRHAGFRPADGSLAIVGHGLAIDVQGLRTRADADLSVALSDYRLALNGNVTVLQGAYRERLGLAGGLLQALRRSDTLAAPVSPSPVDSMTLNVRVTTREDVVVDNNYARLRMGADLRIVGTLSHPGLLGRATAREGGQIFLGGNVYRIVGSGFIDFADTSRVEPQLDLTAQTRVRTYDVTLGLKGTAADLKTELRSDPPLGQSALVSLLVTGQTPDQAGGVQTAVASSQMLGYLSGEFLGVAGRAVGLDTFRFERGRPDLRVDPGLVATETSPSSRLTVGRTIGPNFDLIFSQSLNESGGLTWIVLYTPKRNTEVKAVSLDNGDRSYHFRHELTFGGTGAGTTSGGQNPELIDAIIFSGQPKLDREELLAQLKLTPGDVFSFHRWQEDRDRLESFYHKRGYYEVRISATRQSSADGPTGLRTTLQYNVQTGPRTLLTVEGAQLPGRVAQEIERAWTRSIFDESLVDEVRAIASRWLADRGYLRASVDVSVTADAELTEKHVSVRIEPGPRTTQRTIEFDGNRQITDASLREFTERQQLVDVSWTNTERLRSGLLALYRSHGMLSAEVTVGAIRFDSERAVMPVLISEGQVFRVGRVSVTGVGARSEREVLQDLGLESGRVFTPADADSARRQLEASYRRIGFNAVSVVIRSELVSDSGDANLAVEIVEGTRQIIGDVAVTGAGRTHSDLIARALKLEPGMPVDLVEWSRAQRRLYDTGVFRNVDVEAEPLQPAAAIPRTRTGGEPVRARVTLQEWPPLEIRYGLQVTDEKKPVATTRTLSPGFSGDITRRNLLGRAASTGFSFRYTADFRAARGFLTAPSLFGRSIPTNLFLSRSREEFGGQAGLAYVQDRTDFTAEQRYRLHPSLEIAYSYNFERNHSFDPNADSADPFRFDITTNIGRLAGTALVDTRDDPIDATHGWFHSSSIEYAADALGSEVRFVKYLLQQYFYRALSHGLVLASAGRLGMARGFGQDVITSEKFFAGGGSSVRGYAQDALSPLGIFGEVAGGNALLVLNQELRFPIFGRVRGVGFLDAGRAFMSASNISLIDLSASVGVGLRLDTPVALLRIDFGVPVTRKPGQPRGRWFFSLGQTF